MIVIARLHRKVVGPKPLLTVIGIHLQYNYQVAFWLLGAGPHRWIRLRFQLWFVHLVPLKSKVFTLSFFGLMHSPLSNSPKREGPSRPQE